MSDLRIVVLLAVILVLITVVVVGFAVARSL
jgi:hypothetical protein